MKIEICTNDEWWRVYGGLDCGVDFDSGDFTDELTSALFEAIEHLGHEAVRAQGQRGMCHGWNGANTFRRKWGGVGTFDDCTDAEWQLVCDAHDECLAEVNIALAELA